MRTQSIALLIGTGAVVGTFLLVGNRSTPSPKPESTPLVAAAPATTETPVKKAFGHLILQLEGNIHGLTVTWITPKKSGYNETRVRSKFEIDLFDGRGAKLGTYPVDLANFDTNPANVGKPLRVEGCEVRDSKIVTIVNVPYFAETASMRIRNGGLVIGKVDQKQITKLVARGELEQGEVR